MKNNTQKTKMRFAQTLLIAAVMVGASTVAFQGLTQVVMAAENNRVTVLPTTYPTSVSSPAAVPESGVPDGYTKPTYTVVTNSLEFYQKNKPTANDISQEEAAEFGVQALWSVYGLDLNGKTVEMGYRPAEGSTRAKWVGDYWVDGQKGPDHPLYTFTVDAVTGEVNSVFYARILKEKVDLGYDAKLAKEPTAIEAIAQKYAEDLNVTGGRVKSSTIGSQGYSMNDPTVNFRIVGENGKLAIIGLSRYDNALLAVTYHEGVVEADAAIAQIEQNIAKAENGK